MICPACHQSIEQDSLYCDQCGKEVLVCSQCGQPGTGEHCVQDGKPLVAAKSKRADGPSPVVQKSADAQSANQVSTTESSRESSESISNLSLHNYLQGLRLDITDGFVLCRESGEYAEMLCKHKSISSRHAQFLYDRNVGWTVKDLGSTNGTAIGATPAWQSHPKLKPHIAAVLHDGDLILIGRVEFHVRIG